MSKTIFPRTRPYSRFSNNTEFERGFGGPAKPTIIEFLRCVCSRCQVVKVSIPLRWQKSFHHFARIYSLSAQCWCLNVIDCRTRSWDNRLTKESRNAYFGSTQKFTRQFLIQKTNIYLRRPLHLNTLMKLRLCSRCDNLNKCSIDRLSVLQSAVETELIDSLRTWSQIFEKYNNKADAERKTIYIHFVQY